MILEIIAYIIIIAAISIAAIMIYQRWHKPTDCSKYSGCHDCPLNNHCNKQEQTD